MYSIHLVITVLIARHLSPSRDTPQSLRLQQSAVALNLIGFSAQRWLPHDYALAVGGLITEGTICLSVVGMAHRIGKRSSVARIIRNIPSGKFS